MKQIKFLVVAFTLLMGISLTSCLNSNDNSTNFDWSGYVTIDASGFYGVTLRSDFGDYTFTVVNADSYLKNTTTNEYAKRAVVYLVLKEGDVLTKDKKNYSGASIVAAQGIATPSFCTTPDTINPEKVVPLASISQIWGATGYVNVIFQTNYLSGTPTFELYPDKVEGDELTLRFTQTNGNEYYGGNNNAYLFSYKLPSYYSLQMQLKDMNLDELEPVQDSIYVSVVGTGRDNTDLIPTIGDKKFRFPVNF